ncbi:MAG: hypothetical protein Q7W56_13310 [Candidatus Latescibacteria bacterium]|nr:hypothetical protein [Candidatus Latescibacterota bacterium]
MKILITLALTALALFAGCGQDDVQAVREAAAVQDGDAKTADDALQAELVFCRRIGAKSGKRLEVGDSFKASDDERDRNIHAFADLRNLPPGVHQIHVVWLKPGGEELFRKYAEVSVAPADSARWRTQLVWKDGNNLHFSEPEEAVVGPAPELTVASRLNVAPDRKREPGTYAVKVYWNRELMLERNFHYVSGE